MNYIYDILLNVQEYPYDFYEWNPHDDIIHIRKIPIVKISSEQLLLFRDCEFSINDDFLEKIEDKTEIFTKKATQTIPHAFLATDGSIAIGIMVKNRKLLKSLMKPEEEAETIASCSHLNTIYIEINNILPKKIPIGYTRKEININQFVSLKIQKLNDDKDYEFLKYLGFEAFDIKDMNPTEVIKKIETCDTDIKSKIYELLKLKRV